MIECPTIKKPPVRSNQRFQSFDRSFQYFYADGTKGSRSNKLGNFAGRTGRAAALSVASSARTASRRTPCSASRHDRQMT
ncbi:MAG: hypothetical protein A3I66_15415 [Burkholderiales bacterium RIFCSPLOWO2_02_FULL_57_36]|nr:MAG: hypothetical protein A3I66_15415 [Burkholderiales bacterium RIFCSPLOWO2_02_FULL_57_36]